jgi:hypothetical protein
MKGSATFLLIVLFACTACRNTTSKTSEFVFPVADSVPVSESQKLSPEAIADISKNITSPVEIANLLLTLDVPFSPNYLATSIDPKKQGTNFDKALELGILGADLGYLNIYEKTGSSLDVLSSIRKLSEDIKVGQFFDFETIKRLSQNKSNLDSLLFISIDSYNQIDNYLRANDRAQLSALMILGVWLEGQYIATQVVSKVPNKILSDRIGEQKIILNDLIFLISPYCNRDTEFQALCRDLFDIKDKYRDIRITYTQGDPISVEKNGGLTVTQTETSVVEMTKEQLDGIIEITKKIRNRFVLNN